MKDGKIYRIDTGRLRSNITPSGGKNPRSQRHLTKKTEKEDILRVSLSSYGMSVAMQYMQVSIHKTGRPLYARYMHASQQVKLW